MVSESLSVMSLLEITSICWVKKVSSFLPVDWHHY